MERKSRIELHQTAKDMSEPALQQFFVSMAETIQDLFEVLHALGFGNRALECIGNGVSQSIFKK